MNRSISSNTGRTRGLVRAVLTAAAVFAAGSFADDAVTATIPVSVNVASTVTISPPPGGIGNGETKNVAANTPTEFTLQLNAPTPVTYTAPRAGMTGAQISRRQGNITLDLSTSQYARAQVSLHSINGRRVMSDRVTAAKGMANISSRNVAAGVYLLSVKGVNGNSFQTKLTHGGGNMNIKVVFDGGARTLGKQAAQMSQYGEWSVTVTPTENNLMDSTFTITPAAGTNSAIRVNFGSVRYETMPYATPSSGAANSTDYEVVHSAYDDDYYYYVLLLGHVNRVPILFRDAVIWDGTVSSGIQIGFEKSAATEQAVTRAVTTATSESVSKAQELNYGLTLGMEASAKGGFLGIGEVGWKASVSASIGGSTTWASESVRSREETVETAISKVQSETDTYSISITNDDPHGKYRITLFGTTDVYAVIQTNKDLTGINDAYLAFCARPATYAWGVDYEPDFNGTFAKNTPFELLQLPDPAVLLPALSAPTSNDLTQIPAPARPEANYKGGSDNIYRSAIQVTLESPNGGTIYYTTDGNIPNANSTQYTGPITISQNTVLMAVVIVPGRPTSDLMTESYTIQTDELKTAWILSDTLFKVNITSDVAPNPTQNTTNAVRVTDSNSDIKYDWISVPSGWFDPTELGNAGFSKFRITITYDIWSVNDGWIDIRILQGHSSNWNDQNRWGLMRDDTPGQNRWYTNRTFVSRDLTFTEFGNFTIAWDASGDGPDTYYYANVRVMVTAHKTDG